MKYLLLFLIFVSATSFAKEKWLIVPFKGSEQHPLYYKKDSFYYNRNNNKVYAVYKNNFGTPPNQVEKLKVIIHVEYDCSSKEMLFKQKMYAIGIPVTKQQIETEIMNQSKIDYHYYAQMIQLCYR